MRVLVSGGAGYIGSHTVRALRGRGRDVVVLDNLSNGREDAVLGSPLVVGDIDDGLLVEKVVAEYEVDSCIHFAALKAVGESMEQPARYFDNNVSGSATLIDGLQRSGVDRFVFSTANEAIKHDLHLSDATVGLLGGTAFALLYGVMVIPFAVVSDRGFAARLAAVVAPTPVRLCDERLSTVSAEAVLREQGRKGRRRRAVVDQAAAVVILQNALETERGTGSAPGEVVVVGPDA